MPKSIHRLVVDRVRILCLDLRHLSPVVVFKVKVPKKSLSNKLNNVLVVVVVVAQTN